MVAVGTRAGATVLAPAAPVAKGAAAGVLQDDDDDDFDFSAAFRARKDAFEGGEMGVKTFRDRKESIDGGEMGIKSRSIKRQAKQNAQQFRDEAQEELANAAKTKINIASLIFIPTILAIVYFFFSISLDPLFKGPDPNASEEILQIQQRTQKEMKKDPKATQIDFKELLKDP